MVLNIIKGSLKNTVDETAFRKLYEPNGWQIDSTARVEDEIVKTAIRMKNETEAKNYIKMTRHSAKSFDDKLFHSEVNNV